MIRETKTETFKYIDSCDNYWEMFDNWVKEREIHGWKMMEHHCDGYDDTNRRWEETTFIKI